MAKKVLRGNGSSTNHIFGDTTEVNLNYRARIITYEWRGIQYY